MARNIFTRFDRIKRHADSGRAYAVYYYLCYTDSFTKAERDQIDHFRKYYEENNNNITAVEKYSDEQIDIIDRYVSFARRLPIFFITGWLRWLLSCRGMRKERERQKRIRLQREADAKNPKKRMEFETEKQFLDNRYQDQQQYFSKKAGECKAMYITNQKKIMKYSVMISVISVASIFVGSLLCAIFGWKDSPAWLVNGFDVLIAVISAITAYISSNDKLFQNLAFWARYRIASEKLKNEYALYQGRCGAYNISGKNGKELALKKFRENVELIVQKANDNVMKLIQSDNANLINGVEIEKTVEKSSNNAAEKALIGEKKEDGDESKGGGSEAGAGSGGGSEAGTNSDGGSEAGAGSDGGSEAGVGSDGGSEAGTGSDGGSETGAGVQG